MFVCLFVCLFVVACLFVCLFVDVVDVIVVGSIGMLCRKNRRFDWTGGGTKG